MARPQVLDARPDRLDLRDLPYRAPLRSLPPRYPVDADVARFLPLYVERRLILDQGTEGACTGFGLACVANYLLWIRQLQDGGPASFLQVSPRMLYELARRYDEWPGTRYEGSSCRGALKGWHKHGVCRETLWPYPLDEQKRPVFERPKEGWELDAAQRPLGVYYRVDKRSIVDLQAAIVDIGAVYVSATVHDGWDNPGGGTAGLPGSHDLLPEIGPCRDKESRGGHAFALVGYNERGFVVQNSWGPSWGASGFAVLPYGEWVVNATDAWALALGVPAVVRPRGEATARTVSASGWRVASGSSLTTLHRKSRNERNPADDPWPVDHAFDTPAYEPWSTAAAYEHTLVTGNEGELEQTDFTRHIGDLPGLVRQVAREAPFLWHGGRTDKVLKIAIYAHGGLNDEGTSIRRIRVLGPYFEANGIYPLFLTWKTGPAETVCNMAADWARRELGEDTARSKGKLQELGEAKDRALEAAARTLVRGLWLEMRENAQLASTGKRGLDLLAENLAQLAADLAAGDAAQKLELHLIGHSAGSIPLGHFLKRLADARPAGTPAVTVKTCSLWGAACSVRFANEYYLTAHAQGVLDLSALHLHVLTDDNERADALPSPSLPAYGKSLLYLVSRALDDVRKMPLLGMCRALDGLHEADGEQWAESELPEIQAWRSGWDGKARGLLHVVQAPNVTITREQRQSQATHGSFDNNIEVITQTLERIRGTKLVAPLEWFDY